MWLIYIGTVLLLLVMAWQDLKFRAVSLWLFVLVGMGLVYLKYQLVGFGEFFADLKLNFLFLGLQLVGLFGYFGLKERRLVNLFAGYFGEGDLLFLILLACYLSFFNLLFFYISSLLLALVLGLYLRRQNPKIPLAGLQAFLLAALMVADIFFDSVELRKNFWLMSFFPQ